MTAISIVAALNVLEQQHQLLHFLIDLSFKSSLILILAFSIQLYLGTRAASLKSIVWMMVFAALIFLPLFHEIFPRISLPINYDSTALAVAHSNTALVAENFETKINSFASSLFGAALGYLLICGLLISYLLSGILKVVFLTRLAKPFKHEVAQQKLQQLKQLNGVDRPIDLLVSPTISSPLTWGIWRHKIIFPLAANGWSAELFEQSISHELGHIQRSDWILQILARTAVSLYWINPLIWLAHRNLLIESEKACDDVAVDNTGCALSYAQNLLQLATSFNSQKPLLAPALLGVRSSLSHRIRHILKQERTGRSSDTSSILPGLFWAALVVAPFSSMSITLQEMKLPVVQYVTIYVTIPVSFFPNNSKEFSYLMAEFQ